MTDLAEALLAHPPRETSGSLSANRFEFQRTWALCHLLHLHESGQCYVLILEFHDDVLVLDGDLTPQEAEFFQVKTRKDGHWSKSDLLKTQKLSGKKNTDDGSNAGKYPPRSILGKLMVHVRHLAPHVKTLNIVSNLRFSIPLATNPPSTDRERFSLIELKEDALQEVKDAIKNELGLENEPPWDKVYLSTCGMSIVEHEKYGTGELAAFLERRRPGGRFAVQPLFRTLCGELTRRATNEWKPTSFEELCQKKGIRRADLEGFLRLAECQPDPEEQLRSVKDQLTKEGLPYRAVFDIEQSWRRYDVERMDRANVTLQTFKEQVSHVVYETSRSLAWVTLREFLTEAEIVFFRRYGSPTAPFDNKYLKGAVLLELKAHEARQLPTPNPQPPPGTP